MIHGDHPPLQDDLFTARATDPISSHESAARGFDQPEGGLALRRAVLDVLAKAEGRWLTCRQIIEAIYGPGPYTYRQAVGLNKVQTVALHLWRAGMIERRIPAPGARLEYRRDGGQ